MNYSLYIHVPFCAHRCAYCDFNTYDGQQDSLPAYVNALCREIEFVGQRLPSPHEERRLGATGLGARGQGDNVHTIFFGGGTPSLLSPDQFDLIFHSIRNHFSVSENAEITIEANPGTVSFDQLQRLRSIGVNRISLGVQSANVEELRMLERLHDFLDVINSVGWARAAGFNNLNLDLIYGLPEQTLQTWQTTVNRILDLRPDHISAYALTLEHGTPFGRWVSHGLMPVPDPDLAAEMYEWAGEAFASAGYLQYEISNWALDHEPLTIHGESRSAVLRPPSLACRHNLQYWYGLPYLGCGAGAHGYANGYRYSNVLRIKTYIERMNDFRSSKFNQRNSNIEYRTSMIGFPLSPAAVNHHRQTSREDMSEYMMMGLRLTQEGVSVSNFQRRFERDLLDVYQKEIDELIHLGLLEWHKETSEVLRLTSRGRLLGNQVFMRFVE
jgi:oxygen-independent coproporphyrinogen-3 oxidase